MRISLTSALVASLAAGCGLPPFEDPTPPPDATYRVTIEWLEDTCEDASLWATDQPALIDVMRRSDGAANIYSGNAYMPGPRLYEAVSVYGGKVDHFHDEGHAPNGLRLVQILEGNLTRVGLDLTLTSTGVKDDGVCERKVRLQGVPRALADRSVADGRYRLHYLAYGQACDGEPLPAPLKETDIGADVDPMPDGSVIVRLNGDNLVFQMPMPGRGSFEWHGNVWNDSTYVENDGAVTGTLGASRMDLKVALTATGESGCPYRYGMSGPRIHPSSITVDNDYAVRLETNEECLGKISVEESPIELVSLADGGIALRKWSRRIELSPAGDGSFVYEQGMRGDFEWERHVLRLDPPYIDYFIERGWQFPDGRFCKRNITGTGTARFIEGR